MNKMTRCQTYKCMTELYRLGVSQPTDKIVVDCILYAHAHDYAKYELWL